MDGSSSGAERLEAPGASNAGPAQGETSAPPTARKIWVDLLLYPTHSIPTASMPVLVGLGLAAHDGVLSPVPALVGFLGSWVIHVAGVFTDNHELLRKHPDVPEHPELTEAIRSGALTLATLRMAIAACLAVAMLTAPYLVRIGGAPVIAFGAIGIVMSLSYNGGPWAYVRRGIADPIFLLMFGLVGVAGTYFIQAAAVRGAPDPWRLLATLPPATFLVGLPGGAIVTAVMLIDDLRDRTFDAAKGWRTGAVRFGAGFSRVEITALVAAATLAPLVFWLGLGLDAWVLLPLASAPLAARVVQAVWTVERRADQHPLTPRMARLALLHSALLGLGLALSS